MNVPGSRKKQEVEVEGQKVSVSNLDKVLYPSGFTKAQVIDYYVRVSGYLLPHVRNRPVTLKRYPDGTHGPHFYQKSAPASTPDWIETFPVARRRGGSKINYVLLNGLPALVWSANLANLEIHPFLHRAPAIDRPTHLVFDLDPGEGMDVLACAKVAFLLRSALESVNLQSFAKVSGSKGIQVYAPLNTPVTYSATTPFARSLAESLEQGHPELVVSGMSKAERKRKVFIDWSQNSDFKTTVSVYSLRAKSAAPYVSLPFTWDELHKACKKNDARNLYLEPQAALKRLEKSGDLFAPVLQLQQRLPGGHHRTAARR